MLITCIGTLDLWCIEYTYHRQLYQPSLPACELQPRSLQPAPPHWTHDHAPAVHGLQSQRPRDHEPYGCQRQCHHPAVHVRSAVAGDAGHIAQLDHMGRLSATDPTSVQCNRQLVAAVDILVDEPDICWRTDGDGTDTARAHSGVLPRRYGRHYVW